MSDVIQFPEKANDVVPEMIGPQAVGNSVVIDGRIIPNMMCIDRGKEIEFILDSRFSYTFPRELSYLAAAFAAQAMAIGAGYPFLGAESREMPFAPKIMHIDNGNHD